MQSLPLQALIIGPLQIGLGARWNAFPSDQAPWVAFILLVVGLICLTLARRLGKRTIRIRQRIGGTAGVFVFASWALSAVSVYYFFYLLASIGGLVPSPVAVVTYGTAVLTLLAIAGLVWMRTGKVKIAFLCGLVAAVVGAMVFELPYLFIIAPRIGPTTWRALLTFSPLFCLCFSSYTLLFLTPGAGITRHTFLMLGAIFIGFSLWAFLTDFAFPSDTTSFALNSVTKVLSFVAAATLFLREEAPPEQRNSQER